MQNISFSREQIAVFNQGLKIIDRLDDEFKKIKFSYMSNDGYAILQALERLYAELIPELKGVTFLKNENNEIILIAERNSEFEEGELLKSSCMSIINELNKRNENRQNKIITKPILMTTELKERLYRFELWIRKKLNEKGIMMPKKDIEDARMIMAKV